MDSADSDPETGVSKRLGSSTQEQRRVAYVVAFFQTCSQAVARRVSGLGKHAHSRIIAMLVATGGLKGAERTGRPRTFPAVVLEAACCMLVENPFKFMTGKQLLSRLKEEGYVDQGASDRTFVPRLREYVLKQGHKLITNSTKTIFYITVNDAKAREQYARDMLEELQLEGRLRMMIFVDETQLEESPHPKGKMVCTTLHGNTCMPGCIIIGEHNLSMLAVW